MKHLAFVTCKDLSPYFPSDKEPLFTHDDHLAAQYLREQNFQVSPLIWGEEVEKIKEKNFDSIIVRSPWDYMDSEEKRTAFTQWLKNLENIGVTVLNPVPIMLWSLDKHYLRDFSRVGIETVPSFFLKPETPLKLLEYYKEKGPFVLKPCVSAAAKDTFRFLSEEDINSFLIGKKSSHKNFEDLRRGRSFILQPYLKEIESAGEWSLIFLGGFYSHGVLKKPKPGNWLVQDELGGSVNWERVPERIEKKAKEVFQKIKLAYQESKKAQTTSKDLLTLAYARVDLIESGTHLYLSEVELIEPELFFLDRSKSPASPHEGALKKFCQFLQNS